MQDEKEGLFENAHIGSLAAVYLLPGGLSVFEVYRVKDLKDKDMITDVELDMLIEYFKEKKKMLDEAAGKSFKSNGQTYYWIDRKMLP